MAVLNDNDRRQIWQGYMRKLSANSAESVNNGTGSIPIAINKVELRAAIDAIDAWMDANGSSFNTAIPQPARGALTAKQKAELLVFVVQRRFEIT